MPQAYFINPAESYFAEKDIFGISAAGVELLRTRKKLAATASRREGVYNRTGEPSVAFL